ncbi:MAG: nicotinate (nicotinamide) nucleotide adenylyltransferase [Clostridia bacterium]|nr:nicotinate (nicotinamide) nucleotide adenylyltransferase [Clostridia bacterium]
MRIGIFGGTFNPPHKGHKKLALNIKEKADLDRIIIIPTFTPPHKEGKDLASGEHRIKMCEMMFTEDFFTVSDMEISRRDKSYTYYTLLELKKVCPDDELFLIIGSDMLLSFHTWFRYEDILPMVTLCVATREDKVDYSELLAYSKDVLGLGKNEIIIADTEPYECSSTDVRQQLSLGLDAAYMTGREIYDYARLNLLYESPFSEYKRLLRDRLDDYRFLHSLNVAESAAFLADMYGEDRDKAYFAGLLHDIMKNENKSDMLKLMEKGGIILSRTEKANPKLWHAIAGECCLRTELGIKDEEILSAVRYHTTGKEAMSLFDKIIYVADYISAERNYPDVETMRSLAVGNTLDEACLYSLQYTLKSLSEKKGIIHEDSLAFYNDLIINMKQ